MNLKKAGNNLSGFTLIELMVVIVIIGILVAIALPNFIAAQDRAKVASVKSNMHTFQTIVETYAVDFGGLYATGSIQLKSAATQASNSYWKDFKNPFSGLTGIPGACADYTVPNIIEVGKVGYNPIIIGTVATKYFIYGGDKKTNTPIKDESGNPLVLSNN
ncbi:MAG: prepilin-type N-terminal cleavage/methylation domain-containing protein [Candidatus Sericytochromatia bacterium]